jgi:hypothetical protein
MERDQSLDRIWANDWWNAEIRLSLSIALLASLVIIAGGMAWYSYNDRNDYKMNAGFVPVRDITTGLGTRSIEPAYSFDDRFYFEVPAASDTAR